MINICLSYPDVMEPLDIKSLTRELKQAASEPKEFFNESVNRENKKKDKTPSTVKHSKLKTIFGEVATKEEYNTDACVYIDSDIHDVLRQLKSRTKLRIGPFISWLAEAFIREHQKEITALLKRKANRFIDK
jgi:hypothetical protein